MLDEEVVAPRLAAADESVRALLLARMDDAYRLAMFILRDGLAAEDAVQEAALRAWRGRRSLHDGETADGWFTRILVNVCRDELRHRSRRPRRIELDPAAGTWSAPQAADAELAGALARLTADEQSLLALRYGRDLSVPQIAVRLRLPEGTVKSRLHTTLQHLRAALDAERRSGEAVQ